MNKAEKQKRKNELYEYLMARYGASRQLVDSAVEELGLVRSRLEAYFMVRAHEVRRKRRNYEGT